jgi:hypothetical protein
VVLAHAAELDPLLLIGVPDFSQAHGSTPTQDSANPKNLPKPQSKVVRDFREECSPY